MERLQIDLASVVARIEQLRDDGFPAVSDPVLDLVWERVMSCDLRRLRSYLTAEALALLEDD